MDKILLIVDPQVDFISGSLAVEGAKEKMDALASALQNGEIDCDYVMVTKDFHPSNHCSFKENGGQWPPHCVKGTTGSCIYAPLWSVICNYAYRKDTDIFIKGDSPDKEEYSIFDNLESLSVISDILLDFESDPDNEIRVVGIAGDYCVHETICDLIAMGYKDNIVVDPTTKTIVFSNALDFDKCQDIMEYCGSRIRCSFGIGTNLTNDTGFKPANIVMKLISCQMNANQPVYGCVKLSDDAGKHTREMREVNACLVELGL